MRISDWSSDGCSSDLLLWALKESGQIDNTIIIYASDHGERAGAHGMRQKGATMYREEVNIPMIVAHPDFPGGRTTKGLMGAIDLAPTLMTLAGLSADEQSSRFPGLPGLEHGTASCRERGCQYG